MINNKVIVCRNKIYGIVNVAIILTAFIFLISLLSRIGSDTDFSFDDSSIYDWSEDWIISTGNTAGEMMDLPYDFQLAPGKTIILKKKLPDKIKKYNCIMYESKRQDVRINIGGVVRTSYSDREVRGFGDSSPNAIVLSPVYSSDGGADVTILISSNTTSSGNIGKIYFGNEMSIVIMLIKRNILNIAINVATIILSIISLVCFLIYKNTTDDSLALDFLCWFALLAAFTSFSDFEIRQMFVNNIKLCETIGFVCYTLLPAPIVFYFNLILNKKYTKICHLFAGICVFNYFAQLIMQLSGVRNLDELFPVSAVICFVQVTIEVVIICWIKYKKIHYDGINYLFIGLLAFFAALVYSLLLDLGIAEIKLNWMFSAGTFTFLIVNYVYVFIRISREHQRKRDAENANAAKSMFLATMSHEIRTPINAVLGMNEMIRRESSEEQIKEYADNVADAGKSLLALVNDVLDFSKIESGKMNIVNTDYDLKTLLNNLITMTKNRMLGKDLELKLDIDETMPAVCNGDEVRIRQVVTNLLTNAVKYTQEGSVKFSVKKIGEKDGEVELLFSVRDTGMGIKKEDIDKLLSSSFVRVDEVKNRNVEGTGLGLSISRKLLELMGTKLVIDSEYGKGSDFNFVLTQRIVDSRPMGSIVTKEEKTNKKSRNSFEAPGAKILAVDDTRTNLIVIKGLLKPYKCEVVTCETGEECVDECRSNHYDIIFMDHMMPGMDGIETLGILKKEGLLPNTTKVFALTANAIAGASDMYLSNGFDGYISKPIDVGELDACLAEHLPKEIIKKYLDK